MAVPRTCARCHEAIYAQYEKSAHGAALLGEGNPDVPTCIDCHTVHSTPDPRTARFRVNSPQICARCHTDAKKMKRYGLSTAVLQTYVADFHGSTVTLFQKNHPGQQTNKPVCFSCHGVHDIPHAADPEKGLRTKANLLKACQGCHPDATASFPDAWMSHFAPDPQAHAPRLLGAPVLPGAHPRDRIGAWLSSWPSTSPADGSIAAGPGSATTPEDNAAEEKS